MNNQEKTGKFTWFWKWFLNNKAVTALLILLLCLLNILVFTKVSHIFEPIWEFFGVVGLPIILSGLLYYILNPIVDWLEKKNIRRLWSIIGLFVLVLALMIWGIIVLIPKVQDQISSFVTRLPVYWTILEEKTNELIGSPVFDQFHGQLEEIADHLFSSVGSMAKNVSMNALQGIGSVVGVITDIVLAVITTPFILFYLLKDGAKLPKYLLNFLPTKIRKSTFNILSDINTQVSQYVRGQLTVAFAVAVMFIIGFSIIGLDYSITLGIMAGFLNLIPYLGSFLAMVPAVFLGIVGGPILLIKVIIVFVIEQTIEGRFISPLVLGSQMDIHPITIIFILLTAGKLFGIVGVILGIPVYAALKVIITHVFEWYKEVSDLYHDETAEPQIENEE